MDDNELWEKCVEEEIEATSLTVIMSVPGVREAFVEYFHNNIHDRYTDEKEKDDG